MRTAIGVSGSLRLVTVLIGLCLCAGGYGAQVTAVFEGPVADISLLEPHPFTIGDMLRFSVTYESTTPDLLPADPLRGLYYGIQSVSLTVRDVADALIYSASGTDGRLRVVNDEPGDFPPEVYDTLSFMANSPATYSGGTLSGPDIDGKPLWIFDLSWVDYSGTALSSEAMPTSFTPGDFDVHLMSLAWRDGTVNRGILVRELTATTSIAPVPAPAAILLCVAGVGGVAGLRRRRLL